MRVDARLARLREAMVAADLSGMLVSQPESRRYLSGYAACDLPPRDSAGVLLIAQDRQYLLTDPRTEAQAATQAPGFELRLYGGTVRMPEVFAQVVAEGGVRRLGFEAHHLPYALWQELTAAVEGLATLAPAGNVVDALRAVKDSDEISTLRASVGLNDAAFAHMAHGLRVGCTEEEVAWEVEEFLRTHGADELAFRPITVAGPNSAIPHAQPSQRPMGAEDLVLLDTGARVGGYCSDMTRTVCMGAPPGKLADIWKVVLEAQREAEECVRPGMTGVELDGLARAVIERAGYGEAFLHGLGHGIGLEVHEPPWLNRTRGENVLQAGMVFTIEPGIYLPGLGGVRLEDMVLLTDRGAEVLSSAPKKLRLEEVLLDLDQ